MYKAYMHELLLTDHQSILNQQTAEFKAPTLEKLHEILKKEYCNEFLKELLENNTTDGEYILSENKHNGESYMEFVLEIFKITEKAVNLF